MSNLERYLLSLFSSGRCSPECNSPQQDCHLHLREVEPSDTHFPPRQPDVSSIILPLGIPSEPEQSDVYRPIDKSHGSCRVYAVWDTGSGQDVTTRKLQSSVGNQNWRGRYDMPSCIVSKFDSGQVFGVLISPLQYTKN